MRHPRRARQVRLPVSDRDHYYDSWSALHGDYDPRDPRRSPLARLWLGWAYTVARPLAQRGVRPDAVTVAGVVVAATVLPFAALGGRWAFMAALVVVVSALLDNLDGAVAILTDSSTAWGYLLDSLADRASDAVYLLALWLAGAPAGWCVGAGAAVVLLEYGRARAGNAGFGEIGVVTVGERPTRVILTAAALVCVALAPGLAGWAAGAGAAVTAGVCLVGAVQFLRSARRALRGRRVHQ